MSSNVAKSRSRRQKGEGRQNVVGKLEDRMKDGDYYGALQMYKTLYSRHKNNEEFTEAAETAKTAMECMLKYKQETGAMEMGVLLVEAFTDGNAEVTSESKEKIVKLNEGFIEQGMAGANQAKFLDAAVKWSAEKGSRARGDPALHLLLARAYLANEDYPAASRHYLHSEEPAEFTKMIIEWSKKGYNSEHDLFLTRAVLQLLSLENLRDANVVYETYLKSLKDEGIELDTPLVHFCKFLLKTLERDAMPLFQMLRERYGPSLAKDNNFPTYMMRIGQKFYNIQPPQSGLNAIMNLLGGGF